jgi:hypothetical protein
VQPGVAGIDALGDAGPYREYQYNCEYQEKKAGRMG